MLAQLIPQDSAALPWYQDVLTDKSVIIIGFFVLIAFMAGMAIWQRTVKTRCDADLKHAMLERGMSAEDIERILKAKSAGQ